MLKLPRVQAWSISGRVDLRTALAGSRAGGLGVLDCTLGFEAEGVRKAIARLGGVLKGLPFGVRLREGDLGRVLGWGMPANLAAVVVMGAGEVDWGDVRKLLEGVGAGAIGEVRSRGEGERAVAAGVGRLVVCGNEAGGFVSQESSFILLQAILPILPRGGEVWVRGGIGPHGAAGCVAGGATGVVLDGALLLSRESGLGERVRERIAHFGGDETALFGTAEGGTFRGYLSSKAANTGFAGKGGGFDESLVGWEVGKIWPLGQDSALGADLARTHLTVGGIVQAVERAIDEGLAGASRLRSLGPGSALAVSQGTRYPIVQGPMTRVSDRPAFAKGVADAGALPFLALALMRGSEVREVLREAGEILRGQSWGVGLLGFVPPELRREQTEAILEARPPYALIAGGRPDQAKSLEEVGIRTYLHVPSPGLLGQFLREGARRFVLEGRECGGHVGPRSSLVLWEQAARVLIESGEKGVDLGEVHLLYAGGVHDGCSAAVVAGASSALAACGVKVGVLVGTAYLFTKEAVDTGAIVAGFQEEAIRCGSTVLLETGPGHLVRVSPTPFTARFESERQRMLGEGGRAEEIREALEGLNVGRLRVAAKGVDRLGAGASLSKVNESDQKEQGLFMLGQAATLRRERTTLEALHREISEGGVERLSRVEGKEKPARKTRAKPSNVAIVGMASMVPGAADVRRFWENTLRGFDAITEVPKDRWDWELYYDRDPKAADKITSKWGGFVPEVAFDPLYYGMPPTSLPSIEPMHLLTLEVVRAALEDAGYRDRAFPRERTAVVLGAGGGAAPLAMGYAFRSYLPLLDTVIPGAGTEALAKLKGILPEWTEDSFPGILLNVAAGRVANRFDLGGANYTVDAACGSSLAAASLAVRELESGTSDMVILGGADTVQNPFTYLAFSKTQAFSMRGRCRPFDEKADGIVISEGVAVLVLKRLADAERDGDKIYAVIKGFGSSSDGRAKGLTAPRLEGQVRALERAYEKADISPATVGYIEAHGTGTAAGDVAEVSALKEVFQEAGTARRGCALGSVKSSIGHTKCAAGLAGLINATLALHHRVFPPTIGVETPNPKAGFGESPFHLSTRARPWLREEPSRPRRAGVSAFGFGGTNFHVVLEAYENELGETPSSVDEWPAELFAWRSVDRKGLVDEIDGLERTLDGAAGFRMRDLALTLCEEAEKKRGGLRLAIVASTVEDLRAKLKRARGLVAEGAAEVYEPSGIVLEEGGKWAGAGVAFLFPGQGSQSPDMIGELAIHLPVVMDGIEEFDRALAGKGLPTVGPLVYPPPAWGEAELERQREVLASPEVAQPAIGGASLGLLRLLGSLKVEPGMVAGHSYGELVALHSADAYSLEGLAELSYFRGRYLIDAVGEERGGMAALQAGAAEVDALLAGAPGVVAANWNGPMQTVVSGPKEAIEGLLAMAESRGVRGKSLAVGCAFHSPMVAGAKGPLVALARRVIESGPRLPVYSNVTATTYGAEAAGIAEQLGEHLTSPVRFGEMIQAMHDDGARVFIEVGPGSVVTSLTGSILKGKAHLAVACEPSGKKGVAGLLTALGRLFASGVSIDLRALTGSRGARRLERGAEGLVSLEAKVGPSTWLVNGNRARPALGPEPLTFGKGPALRAPAYREKMGEPGLNGHKAPAHSNGQSDGGKVRPTRRAIVKADGGNEVFEAFQQTMQTFLNVQRSTMMKYLESAAAPELNGRAAPPLMEKASANGHSESRMLREFGAAVERVEKPEFQGSMVERRLLEIVRERTGYPLEMLGLGLDLEADLGIDSIKRVEILGSLRESLPWVVQGSESELMDQLSRARTLGAIVEKMNRAQESGHSEIARDVEGKGFESAKGTSSGVKRRLLEAIDAPLGKGGAKAIAAGSLVLVTDDGRGVARGVVERLKGKGYRAIRVVHALGGEEREKDEAWGVDLTSVESVERLTARARKEGGLAGLVHALPLGDSDAAGLDARVWEARMGVELRGLFLLARALAGELERGSARGACVLAATRMGGAFASLGEVSEGIFPGQGGISGLVKTLAREWKGVRARTVDFDGMEAPEVLAERLTDELLTRDERAEVGYWKGRRIGLRAGIRELSGGSKRGLFVREGEPILITGGARGITAAVAADLARRWRPTLLLVGRSPLPQEQEGRETAGVREGAELKARLLEEMGRGGRSVGPAELEGTYRKLTREREIRANLAVMRGAGALVEYAQVDVCDEGAMRIAIEGWRGRYGPLAGVIHGAGVIQDKLLKDKTPEMFDRVMRTKLGGALTLSRLVEPEALRFAAFFSSVAGRFGNDGQSDYAAANDAMNKLAVWLDKRWPARVVSINWGPWSGVGMVAELGRYLGRRGLGMIPNAVGASRLAEELMYGVKGEVEVIVAGDLGDLAGPGEAEDQS